MGDEMGSIRRRLPTGTGGRRKHTMHPSTMPMERQDSNPTPVEPQESPLQSVNDQRSSRQSSVRSRESQADADPESSLRRNAMTPEESLTLRDTVTADTATNSISGTRTTRSGTEYSGSSFEAGEDAPKRNRGETIYPSENGTPRPSKAHTEAERPAMEDAERLAAEAASGEPQDPEEGVRNAEGKGFTDAEYAAYEAEQKAKEKTKKILKSGAWAFGTGVVAGVVYGACNIGNWITSGGSLLFNSAGQVNAGWMFMIIASGVTTLVGICLLGRGVCRKCRGM